MPDLLVATGNAHKVEEVRAILEGLAVTWRTTREFDAMEVDETGSTYRQNALLKASAWSRATGLWTVADDSGLEVHALNGRPGLRSARYAGPGEDPIAKLLAEMDSVPEARRGARFVCSVCLSGPDSEPVFGEGILKGRIAAAPKGTGGFGFDPVFIPDSADAGNEDADVRCLAEYPEADKNAISHRGRALRALRPFIERALSIK